MSQIDLIHNSEWDTMIVLDACRHDFFKKCNTFKGKLMNVQSIAPHTYSWATNTFTGKYPWLYFSAHMWIGDKIRPKKPWNAVQHFKKVLPIWETEWNDDLGTVHPNAVGKYVRKYFEENPEEKCIIHYVQPHGPWIGKPGMKMHWTKELHDQYGVMADYMAQVKKPPHNFMKKIYKANLNLVLRSIKKYVKYFPGQVVITADHGEMLGEWDKTYRMGLYLHKENFPKWADTLIKQVPWFIMDR